ncbi:hypothetical protein F4553_004782 [Allocatelliglobosispora scoriae]|uniref:Glycosyltransferase RgtA/B/C/D-like domain-containing protein n=1 Tax=Allocatelliglobosispora scoriae TaxID=643052 RepID=A0A841BWW7_9ACTN|nr:hypothetical protein [Allocatelliglobosispora scoriae]MBB5871403.1 hypothetical protein [Allocatelliglobosispora scoriae]
MRLPRLDRYSLIAIFLGVLGMGWRVWLTAQGAPPTNSDEATMGLAALHVSQGRDLPIYFYGQHYMGTIEAYLSAPLVGIFGPSVWALRVPTVLLFGLFLILMFALVRRAFSAGLAVVVVGLLGLGADRVVKNQLIAGGGYPETAPMVAGLLLITFVLSTRASVKWPAFAGWGLLFGLIVWNHWLPIPFLAGALIMLLASRRLTRQTALVTVGGFLVGVLPLLIDNARSGLEHNSIAVFLGLNSAGSHAALWDRIDGGAWVGLPLGMGLCAPSRCAGWSLWWGPVVVLLLVIAVVLAIRALRRRPAPPQPERARLMMWLLLAGGGLLSLITYVRSPAAADTPIESARYLALLGISLPAALWPLWRIVASRSAWAIPAAVPIVALAATMFAATVAVTSAVPGYATVHDDQAGLIAALDEEGLTYVHGEYWTCNWITYLTDERVTCGVVNDSLGRGLNRYPGYWREEAEAVIAPIGSALDQELARRAPGTTPRAVPGYHIYPAA